MLTAKYAYCMRRLHFQRKSCWQITQEPIWNAVEQFMFGMLTGMSYGSAL